MMLGDIHAVDLASITTRLVDHVLVLHGFLGYLFVGLLCFGEAAFMLGFVLPGETAVIVGGVLASRHHASLPIMVIVVVLSAIVGDSVGYEVGKVPPTRREGSCGERSSRFSATSSDSRSRT
jgi:membrane protein DedA with SNARE-associated domain